MINVLCPVFKKDLCLPQSLPLVESMDIRPEAVEGWVCYTYARLTKPWSRRVVHRLLRGTAALLTHPIGS